MRRGGVRVRPACPSLPPSATAPRCHQPGGESRPGQALPFPSASEKGSHVAEEFEGDLAGAVFWGADLRGARFRDVNLTDVEISHAWLVNVDIDALIEKVVINGVDVTDYVSERDQWHPLRD